MARWIVAPVACIWRTMGSTLAASQSATCSAEPEEHATMLVTVGTLVAGLAVAAIAFEPPRPRWPLVPPRSGYRAFRFESLLSGSREIAAFRRAGAARLQYLI